MQQVRRKVCVCVRDFIPILWVIPVTLLFSMMYLFEEKSNVEIGDILWNRLGGVTDADQKVMQLMLFTVENMYFMVLFHILYGNLLITKLKYSRFYVFIREKNRAKWMTEYILELLGIVVVYTMTLIGIHFFLADWNSTQGVTLETMKTVILLGSKIIFLLFFTTFFMQLLSVKIGTAVSFVIVYIISIGCVYLTFLMLNWNVVQQYPVILICNPISGLINGILTSSILQLGYIGYNLLINFILVILGIHVIKRVEIIH